MTQEFNEVQITDYVNASLSTLLNRDLTALTASSGDSEPNVVESGMEGRLFNSPKNKQIKYLSSVDPVKWELMIDYGQEHATKDYAEENFQPLNSNLTALSNVVGTSYQIPYFTTSTSMSVLTFNGYTQNLLNLADAAAGRELLGLGSLATVSQITEDNVDSLVSDNAITADKLAFTPISSREGFSTGDIKETYRSTADDGWILLSGTPTIGSSSSGATYRGDTYNNLYTKIWSSNAVSMLNSSGASVSKGSSASGDWSANKRMVLPTALKYINPSCYYQIKI